jgi:DNA-binding beta-propeller fold protein YncE
MRRRFTKSLPSPSPRSWLGGAVGILVPALVAASLFARPAVGAQETVDHAADLKVTEVDLLSTLGLNVNAAGPALLKTDVERNRVVVANTLSSSLSLIDGKTDAVRNIPIGKRALQHLKAEALAIRARTGTVYLAAEHALVVVDPDSGAVVTLPTAVQYEAVAVDEATGNAFLCGRESGELGFFDAKAGQLRVVPWIAGTGALENLNQTPPPPIRKVVALPGGSKDKPGRIAAIDGGGARLYVFDAGKGKLLKSRPLALTPGGRWHLAGVHPLSRALYLVTETLDRRVLQAARIDLEGRHDVVIPLPGFTEGVAMLYDARRDHLIINYDNHPTIHVVDFSHEGAISEIAIPTFGNDAAAMDATGNVLYVASWAHGEIEVVDIEHGRFVRRIPDLGILPHMHAMTYDPANGSLYFPLGATAVNGTFGATVERLDPATGQVRSIRTGWAPIALASDPARKSVLVFDNEDRFAEVHPDGSFTETVLPYRWPTSVSTAPDGRLDLVYGPHQSYWPVVYIWGAKNGILGIKAKDLGFYDRRIPREPLATAYGSDGTLYLAQNNWGKEKAFLSRLSDGIRYWDAGQRIELGDEVERETTQRLLTWEPATKRLLLGRVGEKDGDPGVLVDLDPVKSSVEHKTQVGSCPTALVADEKHAYVAGFKANAVSVVDRTTGGAESVPAGQEPLALVRLGGHVFAADHRGGAIWQVDGTPKSFSVPVNGLVDGLLAWRNRLVVTAHGPDVFEVVALDPATGATELLLKSQGHPYGDTAFDTGNSAFYLCGQFGDAVYTLSPNVIDSDGRLWIGDFLSGRVYGLELAAKVAPTAPAAKP